MQIYENKLETQFSRLTRTFNFQPSTIAASVERTSWRFIFLVRGWL